MKRVLILAYDFPPYVSVGALRPYSWYKDFAEFGIYPIVVTRQWSNFYGNKLDYIAPGQTHSEIIDKSDNGIIIKSPYIPTFGNKLYIKYGDSKYKFIRKTISAFYEFSQWLLPIGTKHNIYKSANNYLKDNKVDIIIATGDPFILFKYASILSKRYSIPWIADYRDPWSEGMNINKLLLLKLWHSFFEKQIVSTSTRITTVSDFFKFKISKVIKENEINIISNGYDELYIDRLEEQHSDTFSIALSGTIYKWHPLKQFLEVIASLIIEQKINNIHVHFYGINNSNEITSFIENDFPILKNHIFISPKIHHEELNNKLSFHNVLLLFNDYSIIGTKIYNYLLVKRKILFCFENDSESLKIKKKYFKMGEFHFSEKNPQAELIRKTDAGIIVQDAHQLHSTLLSLYQEFEENREVLCNSVNVELYSRKLQSKQFCEVIKSCINKH